jgi:hypothetical protein
MNKKIEKSLQRINVKTTKVLEQFNQYKITTLP